MLRQRLSVSANNWSNESILRLKGPSHETGFNYFDRKRLGLGLKKGRAAGFEIFQRLFETFEKKRKNTIFLPLIRKARPKLIFMWLIFIKRRGICFNHKKLTYKLFC